MKKITSLILLGAIFTFSVFCTEPRIITVLDFETSGVSRQEMVLFVDYLSSSVSDTDNYTLIDRRQRETILSEAEFSNSGCADESCAIEIGQILSANEMIVGSIGSIGSLYILNVKLVDVATGKTINDVSDKFDSIESLVNETETVISELFGKDIPKKEKIVSRDEKPAAEPVSIPVTPENSFKFGKAPNEVLLNKEMLDIAKNNEVYRVTSFLLYGTGAICGALDIIGFVGSGGFPDDNDYESWNVVMGLTTGCVAGILGGLLMDAFVLPVYDINGELTDY